MAQGPGLLIASPQLRDPNFQRTVVLMVHHDPEGALGLVINRDGPVRVGDVLRHMELPVPEEGADTPAWWGGPVQPSTGFIVFPGEVDEEEGWNLGRGVAVTQSATILGRRLEAGLPFHLVLGYAGWGPGQLDAEIEAGSWLFADVDPAIVFDLPMAERYERALALLGLTATTAWMQPVDE